MYVLAAQVIRAYRGDVKTITSEMLKIKSQWDNDLKEALEVLEFTIETEPSWLLVSWWC